MIAVGDACQHAAKMLPRCCQEAAKTPNSEATRSLVFVDDEPCMDIKSLQVFGRRYGGTLDKEVAIRSVEVGLRLIQRLFYIR